MTDVTGASSQQTNYRPDLDGMRAVAVLLVMLYHYGIGPVTGGFLGVDVFFVLSGFFITRLIVRGAEAGSFSFAGFYERRARRLLPSALTVLAVTSAVMVIIAPPGELVEFTRSVFASLFFFANLHFKDTFTYFGPAAETQPLLHFWSLSVEEQFYFIAPALLLVLLRLGKVAALIGLIAIGLASLGLSSWQVYAQPPDAFFHLPSRGWQLIAGSVLAIYPLRLDWPGKRLREAIMMLALAVILVQAVTLTRASPFPGLNAVPAVLATMAVTILGQSDARGAVAQPVTWLLANPVMNWIGRLSYSLYLWHWPVLVLYRLRFGEPDDPVVKAILLGLTFSLAAACYYLIEQPIRQQRFLAGRSKLTFGLGAFAAILVGFGAGSLMTNGFVGRAPDAVLRVEADLKRDADSVCHVQLTDADDIKSCALGVSPIESVEPQTVTTLLVGDSHARALQPYFQHEAVRHGVDMLVLYKGDCLPLVSVDFHKGHRLKCPQMKQVVRALPDKYPALTHVFIVARWERITEPKRNTQAERIGLSVAGGPVVLETSERRAILRASLAETVAMFQARGIGVTLIGQVPSYVEPPTRCIIRALWGGSDPSECGMTPDNAARNLRASDKILSDVAAGFDGVDAWQPGEALCLAERCAVFGDGYSLYRDDNHLSVSGSFYLATIMPVTAWPD